MEELQLHYEAKLLKVQRTLYTGLHSAAKLKLAKQKANAHHHRNELAHLQEELLVQRNESERAHLASKALRQQVETLVDKTRLAKQAEALLSKVETLEREVQMRMLGKAIAEPCEETNTCKDNVVSLQFELE